MLAYCKRKALEKGDILELESYDSQHYLAKQKIVIEKDRILSENANKTYHHGQIKADN